ncbi:MAG: hypothetical protein JXJ17_00935 [Anaerolineae bacterium]|nr:hypothetical protein [Anaerolineae bacterium]
MRNGPILAAIVMILLSACAPPVESTALSSDTPYPITETPGRTPPTQTEDTMPMGTSTASEQSSVSDMLCSATITKKNVADLMELTRFDSGSAIMDIALSPDGELLVSSHRGGNIRVWDIYSGELINELEGHTKTPWQVAFSPDGTMLASGSWDQTVKIWNVESGTLAQTLDDLAGGGPIVDMAFSYDGKQLTASSSEGKICQWETGSWHVINQYEGNLFAFNADSSILVTTQRSGPTLIRRTQLEDIKVLNPDYFETAGNEITEIEFIGSTNNIVMAFLSDFQIWDVGERELLYTGEPYQYGIQDIAISPAGELISIAYHDDTLRLFNTSGELITTFDTGIKDVSSVTFSPQGNFIAFGSFDGVISIWGIPDISECPHADD